MNLFENAIAAIQVGIEDFESKDERRALSSVRNIFSGLVLLYKSKLWELSPQNDEYLLIKNDLLYQIQDDRVFVSSKKPKDRPGKTVNIHQIQERFDSLCIDVNWGLFDKLKKERDNIEHFYSSRDNLLLRNTVNDAFSLISDFIESHLELDVKETLGQEYWQVLIKNQKVYSVEKEKCNKLIESIECSFDWVKPYLNKITCEFCGSDLVSISEDSLYEFNCVELKCRNCDKSITDIPRYVVNMIARERYDFEASKSGWNDVAICPSCSEECFIRGENVCLSCDYQPINLVCRYCETETDIENLDEDSICSYCNHRFSKD